MTTKKAAEEPPKDDGAKIMQIFENQEILAEKDGFVAQKIDRMAAIEAEFRKLSSQDQPGVIGDIAEWITEYSEACAQCFSVPRGMVDTAMLAVASSSIGDKVHVQDGAFDTNVSLWCVLIAQSGAGKTPSTDEVMRPVKRQQAAQYDIYQSMMAAWKALPKKEREVQAPPIFLKRYVSDTTPESLYTELSRHADGLLLYRDEIAGWVKDFGRYNNSGEVENLLSIFSGQPITITRKTQDPVVVGKTFLSILGGIQPGAAKKVLAKEDFADSGFLGRFLWCYPECDIREDYEQQSIDKGLQTLWSDAIAYMYGLPKVTLTLSDSALNVKRDFYKATIRKLKAANNTQDTFLSAMYGKFPTYADRIAGVLHVLANIGVSPLPSCIGGITYQQAVRAMGKYEEWGRKVGAMYGGGHTITQEEAILALHRVCPILNQSKFAEAVGKTQQYINKVLSKLRL